MITVTDTLPGGPMSEAEIQVLDGKSEPKIEAQYVKDESGNVHIGVDDVDDVPRNVPVKLTLLNHDRPGNNSEYHGRFNDAGQFV